MKIDNKRLILFKQNWNEAQRNQAKLNSSLTRLAATFPLQANFLQHSSEQQIDSIDAFRVRFADLQDCIGNKLFKGILLLEEEQPTSTLDTLHKMEKRQILPDVELWREIRHARNAFAHDYPESDQEKADTLNYAFDLAPELEKILNNVQVYCQQQLEINLCD